MPRSRKLHQRDHEGRRLKTLRELLRLSQRDLAREFNVASGAIAQWQSGEHTIPGPVLKLIDLYEKDLGVETAEEPLDFDEHARSESGFIRRGPVSRGASTFLASALWLVVRELVGPSPNGALGRRAREIALEQFVRTVWNLKGLSTKIGQMSGYLDFLLQESEYAIFQEVRAKSRAMTPAMVQEIFLREFGQTPRELFAEWSPQAFAIASMGQVHRARLRSGEQVAVKVQYPRMAETLKSDLEQLRRLDQLAALIWRSQKRDTIFAEWRARFLEECDYAGEAKNQNDFARLFAGAKEMHFPRTIDALCTTRILTSTFAEGNTFAILKRASQAERNRTGETIWHFFQESLFRHGIFNTDPNPDNFVFGDNGHVTFLDFGRVKRLAPSFLVLFKKTIRSVLERDMSAFKASVVQVGIAANADAFDFEYAYRVALSFYRPFLCAGNYQFSADHLAQAFRFWTQNNPNFSLLNYPADVAFMDQFYLGVGAILTQLKAEVACRKIMLDLLYAPGEERPEPFTVNQLSLFGLT